MRKRFFRAAMLSIVIGLLAAFLLAVPLMEQVYTEETQNRLEAALSLLGGYALPSDTPDPYQELAQQASARLGNNGQAIRITLVALDGRVLGDSEVHPADMGSHTDRPEIQKALAMGRGQNIRRSQTTGQREMYFAMTDTLADGTRLILRASLPLDGFLQAVYLLWGCACIGIFVGLIMALFTAQTASARLMRPLDKLIDAVRRLSEGDAGVTVETAPDEMGQLSAAFNRMSLRLADTHRAVEQSNKRLAGVLQGMEDGVAAIAADGRIVLLTRRAQELLGTPPPCYERLDDCGTNYLYIKNLLNRALKEGGAQRETLYLAGPSERILQVYAARIGDGPEEGALAVLADVTRLRQLETMRSEFVANVTHEFKTPLTSIRGYVELLRSEPRDAATTNSFYEIIEIEAERLQKLTDDLLQLSEIESLSKSADVEYEAADVASIAQEAASSLRPIADTHNITICIDVPSELRVQASPRRLQQLLKNLMENAINYNRPGGRVEVTAGLERGIAVIRVSDTGIGIPPEHQKRIFERFYRVDKGRSREQGGTGLGLAIVKHIVSLYGGELSLESTPGIGSVFTVRLHSI